MKISFMLHIVKTCKNLLNNKKSTVQQLFKHELTLNVYFLLNFNGPTFPFKKNIKLSAE